MTNNNTVRTLWKSLSNDMKSDDNDFPFVIGEWYTHADGAKMYRHGFHASEYIADTMRYTDHNVTALVDVCGSNDKIVDEQEAWESMRIVKAYEWNNISYIKLAIFAAESALDIFEKYIQTDDRPRKAIDEASNSLNLQNSHDVHEEDNRILRYVSGIFTDYMNEDVIAFICGSRPGKYGDEKAAAIFLSSRSAGGAISATKYPSNAKMFAYHSVNNTIEAAYHHSADVNGEYRAAKRDEKEMRDKIQEYITCEILPTLKSS